MERRIDDYLINLINSYPLITVPSLSTNDDRFYKIDCNYGRGSFRVIKFDKNPLLILIADFTLKNKFEKVTEVSEKYLEISQFESNSSSFKIGGRKLNRVEKGIFCYLNRERKTYTYCEANKPVKFTKIILTKDYFDIFLESRYRILGYKDIKFIDMHLLKAQNSPQMNFVFQQIRESQAEGAILQLYLESKVMELLSLLIEKIHKEEKNLSVTLTRSDKENLSKTVTVMKKDLSMHLDALELSQIALMSPARFQLAFRKYYGVPPYEYLRELRFNKALILLKNFEEKISTIAKEVGYSHAGHFAQVFKSKYGMTPSQYRIMLKEE